MRFVYLLPKEPRNDAHGQACRGGVASPDGAEYVLEIGNQENCDPLMLSLAAHSDEISHFLRKSSDPLADMLLTSIERLRLKLALGLIEQSDENPAWEESEGPALSP